MKTNHAFINPLLFSTFLFSTLLRAEDTFIPNSSSSVLINLNDYSEEFGQKLLGELIGPFLSAKDLLSFKLGGKKIKASIETMENNLLQAVSNNSNSEIYQAYMNLPTAWKTPIIMTRIITQAEEISRFPQAFGQPMIEFLAALGINTAVENKIKGLRYALYGYIKNEVAANAVAKPAEEEYCEWALGEEFKRLLYQKKAIEEAHALLDKEILEGVAQVIDIKFDGLQMSIYGYKKNPEAARRLLDDGIAKGHLRALEKKYCYLRSKVFGYTESNGYKDSEITAHKLVHNFFGLPLQ
jgi:hypothetical protein